MRYCEPSSFIKLTYSSHPPPHYSPTSTCILTIPSNICIRGWIYTPSRKSAWDPILTYPAFTSKKTIVHNKIDPRMKSLESSENMPDVYILKLFRLKTTGYIFCLPVVDIKGIVWCIQMSYKVPSNCKQDSSYRTDGALWTRRPSAGTLRYAQITGIDKRSDNRGFKRHH